MDAQTYNPARILQMEYRMKEKARIAFAVLGMTLAAGSLFAHHAFALLFDAERVHNLKGVVTKFVWANPHSLIFLDTRGFDGQLEHWAIEAPSIGSLTRMGLDKTTFKPGDTLEVCGYGTKDGVDPMRSFTPPEPISLSLKLIPRPTSTGQLVSPAILTLSSGQKLVWSSTGKCLESSRN
jgi:hypothetical protein